MNKIIQYIKKNFNLIVLLVGLIISFQGLYMIFVLGFHSFDMAQNVIFIRDDMKLEMLENGIKYNPVYIETNLNGDKSDLEDVYVDGIRYFFKGILITILGVGTIGYAIGKLEK